LKGYAASNKRHRQGKNKKMKIEFSERLGGPVGGNQRSFVDEIVVFTRLHAPLIGIKKWKEIDDAVKDEIASDVLVISFNIFLPYPSYLILHMNLYTN
jgi:hypothetical protein